jgi:precorrin-2 dehydrogenase / sirohydrochlorin ferrochelatase
MTRSEASLYPLSLHLAGRRCVVIGGGKVAERKVRGLLTTGALVVVIAPHLTPGLRALVDVGCVAVEQRRYLPGDLSGATLAFAATDQRAVNAAVAAEAREVGVLVNVADAPDEGDFSVPAVARRGDLAIGVSTAGESPAVAALVRDRLIEWLDDGMSDLLTIVAALRREEHADGRRHSAASWRAALNGEALNLTRDGRIAEAETALRSALRGGPILPTTREEHR